MEKKISFIFGIHNHQPIGNFDNVFVEAYQKAYFPFLDVLSRHPDIKWNLHCTGILWEWIEKNHPEYHEKAKKMVERGQLEIVSGAFYEPILPIIPDVDKIGQIKRLNEYIKSRFNVTPKGLWCAERVWEPHLPKYLRQAGIEYTVLDDMHFLSAGLSAGQLKGFYRVEEQNDAVDIFPIAKDLRYSMPFSNPEVTIDILRKAAESHIGKHEPVLVMADDGEKFGLWPKTDELVYGKEAWLERFLTLVEKNSSWIITDTFSGYRQKNKALGKIYLPTSSYFEMSEWSLFPDSGMELEDALHIISRHNEGEKIKRFVKGGIWRNFFAKYPEANSMYKKMLRVSSKVHNISGGGRFRRKGEEDPQKHDLRKALDRLWAGQCNCSYWHGVFGGLYLPVLRQAIYKNLLEAETIADDLKAGKSKPVRVESVDYDADGNEEVLVESRGQNLYFSPENGGSVIEWDFRPALVNISNVLSRRQEIYHRKLKDFLAKGGAVQSGTKSIHDEINVKESGLQNLLQYDWYRRSSLIDHFLHPSTTPELFQRCQYGEQGDFVLGRYEFGRPAGKYLRDIAPETGKDELAAVHLSRKGAVWANDKRKDITVEKTCVIYDGNMKLAEEKAVSHMDVYYRITNTGQENAESLWFASELNFAVCVPEKEDRPALKVARWERADKYLKWKIAAEFSEPADVWVMPIETVSNSEGGFEKTFQGITVLPSWKFSLAAGQTREISLRFNLEKI